MNALFLINEPITNSSGISKKILSQVNALKSQGLKVFLSYLKENGKYKFLGRFVDEIVIDHYSRNNIISKFQRRFLYRNLYKFIKEHDVQLVYIRYIHFANPFFISFLKKLKSDHILILLELPTYPYDQEYKNATLRVKLAFLIEKSYRNKFKKYVTRIVTLSEDRKIFDVPTIQISNGIDARSIKMKQLLKADEGLHLIGVATISFWHGYDRVIEGLNNYYKDQKPDKRKVFFHIVGDSFNSESLRYKQLVEKYKLNKYVTFYGNKSGKELDDLFDMMDMAVGCLGSHRKGFVYSKSLKNREYCARGIPFFYAETDSDFENKEFIYKVSPNEEAVDINTIIDFIVNKKFDRVKIRNFALTNLSWDKQFKKVMQEVMSLS